MVKTLAKGCRRVEFDRRDRFASLSCTRVFAWHSPGAVTWRQRVREVGHVIGAIDMGDIRRRLGPRWAYRLRDAITLSSDVDWREVLQSLASEKRLLRIFEVMAFSTTEIEARSGNSSTPTTCRMFG